jgi:hypothetical protein
MKEDKAFKLGIAIIIGSTVATPALAGLLIPTGIDDMGVLPFLLTFGFLGVCIGILAAKVPKKYIRE